MIRPFKPSLSRVAATAALATHGYITYVGYLGLIDLDLNSVSAGNLANLVQCVHVHGNVWISGVRGDLSPVLGIAKCFRLVMCDIDLSTADTQGLLAAMVSGVLVVTLRRGVTLDTETLSQYDGKGKCGRVMVCWDTVRRYRGQLKSWAKRIGWKLMEDYARIIIERSG